MCTIQLISSHSMSDAARAALMERVMLQVRCHWFGAKERSLGMAVSLQEPYGEMIALIDGDEQQMDLFVAGAAFREAHIALTSFTRPADLGRRLQEYGYRLVQQHGVYVFHPECYQTPVPKRTALFSSLRFRRHFDVSVRSIDEQEIPLWSEVCHRAFESRISREAALQEKVRAYRGAGVRGRWYLAYADGRPVGTASLFHGDGATQVLAVGTVPAYRGRGVASAIMRHILQEWQTHADGLLFLDTSPGSRAERLYTRYGFRQEYLRELYAPGGHT